MSGGDLAEHIAERLGAGHLEIRQFLSAHYARVTPAVYASADVRHAGFKTAPVDTNAFPAGFNNLCPGNRQGAVAAVREFLQTHHPDARHVLLLPEDHTRNPFYLQNVHYLSSILTTAGIDHTIGSADPEVVHGVQGTATPDGDTLTYSLVTRRGDDVLVGGRRADLVFSNNDFTTGAPKPLHNSPVPIIPMPELGWDHRSKAKHFRLYNHLAGELCAMVGLDPWHLTVPTREVRGVDFKKREGVEAVAAAVEASLADTQAHYDRHGIKGTARAFVKDDAGTYGMGITVVESAEEIMALNNRARQKMDKGKYGHKVARVIVQEAIPTIEQVDGHAAEPVFYMVGGRAIGAFMRLHPERGDNDNLNQPGMRFVPICRHRGCHDEGAAETLDFCASDAEQTTAELAALALAYEATDAVRSAPHADAVPLPRPITA